MLIRSDLEWIAEEILVVIRSSKDMTEKDMWRVAVDIIWSHTIAAHAMFDRLTQTIPDPAFIYDINLKGETIGIEKRFYSDNQKAAEAIKHLTVTLEGLRNFAPSPRPGP